jgi:hypothetical protein
LHTFLRIWLDWSIAPKNSYRYHIYILWMFAINLF